MSSPDTYYASHVRCPVSNVSVESSAACLRVQGAAEYVEYARKRLLAAWRLPRGLPADQTAKLKFQIDPGGSVRCLTLVLHSDRTLARSALVAMQRVEPFASLPPESVCLSEIPIVATFTNPIARR